MTLTSLQQHHRDRFLQRRWNRGPRAYRRLREECDVALQRAAEAERLVRALNRSTVRLELESRCEGHFGRSMPLWRFQMMIDPNELRFAGDIAVEWMVRRIAAQAGEMLRRAAAGKPLADD